MRGRSSISIAALLAMAEASRLQEMKMVQDLLRNPTAPPVEESDRDRQLRMSRLGRGPQRKCKRGRR